MAVLDEVLIEEKDRLLRMQSRMQSEYNELPQGCLSKKMIHGSCCYYLQHREGDKVVSKYVNAADAVIVPIQCEFYALEGLSQLIYTIELVRERLNPSLKIDGVVFTMYDARTNLSLQVVENVRKNLNENIYNSIIPRSVRLAEAPSHGLPICLYDAKSAGADAYNELAMEVLIKDKKIKPSKTTSSISTNKKTEDKTKTEKPAKKGFRLFGK